MCGGAPLVQMQDADQHNLGRGRVWWHPLSAGAGADQCKLGRGRVRRANEIGKPERLDRKAEGLVSNRACLPRLAAAYGLQFLGIGWGMQASVQEPCAQRAISVQGWNCLAPGLDLHSSAAARQCRDSANSRRTCTGFTSSTSFNSTAQHGIAQHGTVADFAEEHDRQNKTPLTCLRNLSPRVAWGISLS